MKKIKEFIFWKPWVSGLIIGLVIGVWAPALALTIDGTVDEIKALLGQEEQSTGGALTSTGGICTGLGDPVATMCNVDINYLDVTNDLAVDDDTVLSGDLTVSGTSTIVMSYDGFRANSGFTMATGTAKAVYSNMTGKNLMCQGGGVIADSLSTTLGPAFQVGCGTSTSATGYTTSLIASTTVATTTDAAVSFSYTTVWILPAGNSVVCALSDLQPNASSTYFTSSYWNIDLSIPCAMIDN